MLSCVFIEIECWEIQERERRVIEVGWVEREREWGVKKKQITRRQRFESLQERKPWSQRKRDADSVGQIDGGPGETRVALLSWWS